MKIDLQKIKIRDLINGYTDKGDVGVVAFGGKLDVRPPYQREFVYKEKQRDAVMDTLSKGFPLNVMYWAVKEDGNYEIIDGQQRTISICQYINGDYSVQNIFGIAQTRGFGNLQNNEQEKILNYELSVYICSGTDSEKLEWFKTINIAGEKLTEQELRNAVYSGSFVTDAKRYFSKNGCVAFQIGNKYLTGYVNRQDYLETVIKWISGGEIEEYMSKHQHDEDANELWEYFQKVINWVETTFIKYRKQMEGLPWGDLYNEYKDKELNSEELENEIERLTKDEEVENKKGVYLYVLDRKEKHLNLRTFSDSDKTTMYERQNGVCANPYCEYINDGGFQINEMEADHITPWHSGGQTNIANGQMLCRECNRRKGGR